MSHNHSLIIQLNLKVQKHVPTHPPSRDNISYLSMLI